MILLPQCHQPMAFSKPSSELENIVSIGGVMLCLCLPLHIFVQIRNELNIFSGIGVDEPYSISISIVTYLISIQTRLEVNPLNQTKP